MKGPYVNQKETSMRQSRNYMFSDVLLGTPDAVAKVKGDENHRGLVGYVYFYGSAGGSLVLAEIEGLPYEDQLSLIHISEPTRH